MVVASVVSFFGLMLFLLLSVPCDGCLDSEDSSVDDYASPITPNVFGYNYKVIF